MSFRNFKVICASLSAFHLKCVVFEHVAFKTVEVESFECIHIQKKDFNYCLKFMRDKIRLPKLISLIFNI